MHHCKCLHWIVLSLTPLIACSDSTIVQDSGASDVDTHIDGGDLSAEPPEFCDGIDNDGDGEIDEGGFGPAVWAGATAIAVPRFDVGPLQLAGVNARRFFVLNKANVAAGERQVLYGIEFDVNDFSGLAGPGNAFVTHLQRLWESDPNSDAHFSFKNGAFEIPFDQFTGVAFVQAGILSGISADALAFLGPDGQTLYILEHDPGNLPATPDPKAIIGAGIWSKLSLDGFFTTAGIANPGAADVVSVFLLPEISAHLVAVVVGPTIHLLTDSPTTSFSFNLQSYMFGSMSTPPEPPISTLFTPNLDLFFATKDDRLYAGRARVLPDGGVDAGVDAGADAAPNDGGPSFPVDWPTSPRSLAGYVLCRPPGT